MMNLTADNLRVSLRYALARHSAVCVPIDHIEKLMNELGEDRLHEIMTTMFEHLTAVAEGSDQEEIAAHERVLDLQTKAEEDEITIANPAGTEAPTPGIVITSRPPFYAVVEWMGHKRVVGELYDCHRWGTDCGMVREIDEKGKAKPNQEHWFYPGGGAIYNIRPVDKDEALRIVRGYPIEMWHDDDEDQDDDSDNPSLDDDPGF